LVLDPRAPFGRCYVYCLAGSSAFRRQIEALVTGTSKSHQRAQADAVLRLPVILPPRSVVEKFETFSSGLLERVVACRRELWTLAAIRDTLLPKLVSGELRIPDVERIVGGQL
jgi:type I restriction enzyme S subunit